MKNRYISKPDTLAPTITNRQSKILKLLLEALTRYLEHNDAEIRSESLESISIGVEQLKNEEAYYER